MSNQRYVSRELTHFVGSNLRPDEDKQFELLVDIVKGGVLGRHATAKGVPQPLNFVYGRPFALCNGELCGLPTVCFCDIPVTDLGLHARKYSKFGIAFQKTFLVPRGASPAFYIAEDSHYQLGDTTSTLGNQYLRMLDRLFDLMEDYAPRPAVVAELKVFLVHRLLGYLKPFNSCLPEDARDNYYMEREWRVIGKIEFELEDISTIFIPKGFARRLRDKLPEYCGPILHLPEDTSGGTP